MRHLSSFTFITLNGFYKDANNGIDWHKHGEEEEHYSKDSMKSESILLFGRVTYDMMAGWWPTDQAKQNMPEMAKGMNGAEKIVFSRNLKHAEWQNTKVISGDLIAEVNKLKQEALKDMVILGSGSIVAQLSEHKLIDEYKIMIDPVALGRGASLFTNIEHQLDLELKDSKTFKSGVVLLVYVPK
jgi:dihydrofolate reductase